MADEVKKAQDVAMDSSVDAAQKELAKEGKTYPDNFTKIIDEFDDDVTVIKTKYKVNDGEGTIALIGPKRMEYDRVISLLDYIKHHIDKNGGL